MTNHTNKQPVLSTDVKQKIDHWLTKFPADQKQSAVIAALRFAQDDNQGWLTQEHMDAVADYLGMSKIAVYEVATFYSMFHLKPVGKHVINVCTNISCHLRGCGKIIRHLQQRLGLPQDEAVKTTTEDGRYTLIQEVECLAACNGAPMMQIDHHEVYEQLTPERVDEILDGIERNDAAANNHPSEREVV